MHAENLQILENTKVIIMYVKSEALRYLKLVGKDLRVKETLPYTTVKLYLV